MQSRERETHGDMETDNTPVYRDRETIAISAGGDRKEKERERM